MKSSKLISIILILIGTLILLQVSLPLLEFKLKEGLEYANDSLVSPQQGLINGVSVVSENNFPAFVSKVKRDQPTPYSQFLISLPTLDLKEVPVMVDSNDLSQGLVHLPGSSLPGEKGNIFISGHSALPILTIGKKVPFAKLEDLKVGDEVLLQALGTTFNYKIVLTKVVDPKDLSVINPPDEVGRYLTLMTCVPPGLNTKRLVVLAKSI